MGRRPVGYKSGMSFEPRSILASPSAFGTANGDIAPAEGVEASDHRYRSAMVQHRIARNVESGLSIRGTSLPRFLEDFEGVPGLSLDRQRRVLRGETTATFADLTFWASHFPLVGLYVAQYLEQSFTPKSRAKTTRDPAGPPAPAAPPLR